MGYHLLQLILLFLALLNILDKLETIVFLCVHIVVFVMFAQTTYLSSC